MNRYWILVLFLFSALFAQCQVLTIGEVYDFEVGDVFQTSYQGIPGQGQGAPSSTVTDTIIGKTLYTVDDSVNFIIHRVLYAPPSGPGLPPLIQDQIISRTYASLSDTAEQYYLQDPCPPIVDTVFFDPDFCGRAVWRETTLGDTCFEYSSWTSRLIQGCGGPYYDSFDFNMGDSYHVSLIFFRKGDLECGTFQSIPLGVEEIGAREVRMSIWPVPTSAWITLYLASATVLFPAQVELSIMDLQGRTLKSWIENASVINGLQLDIHELPAGAYILNLSVEGRTLASDRLIKLE